MKEKSHTWSSQLVQKKDLTKLNTLSWLKKKKKKTQETRNWGTFLKLIKGIHEKPTAILLKDERLKTFLLKI